VSRVVIYFIDDVRSQGVEQIQNVQDLTLAGLVGFGPQQFQRLDASFDDKLHHAPIVHTTEPIYQSHSVTLACVDRDSHQSRLGLTY